MAKGTPDLCSVIDDRVVVRPVFEIAVYATTPKAAGAAGYVAFYEAFRTRFGKALTLYQLNDSTAKKKVTAADLGKVPFWFQDKRSLKAPMLGIRMYAGTTESRCRRCSTSCSSTCSRLTRGECSGSQGRPSMPRTPRGCSSSRCQALADFPVHWGTAGYTLLWNDLTSDDGLGTQWQARQLKRHPGLNKGEFTRTGLWADRGLSTVGWLTMLGDAIVEQAGGRKEIEAALSADVVIHDLAHGLLLQAGPQAQLGDVNRADNLPAYASVAQALTKAFPPEDTLRALGVEGMDEDDGLAWHRRFFP